MSVEIVHPVPADEGSAWIDAMQTTFLSPIGARQRAQAMWDARLEPGRRWGARDGGRWVATLGADVRSLTVPGGELEVDAITAVTVAATHTRQGLLRRLIAAAADEARGRGAAVSILVPSEWPIYGRYGYAPAARYADYDYVVRERGAAVEGDAGRVRPVPVEEFATLGAGVFGRSRRERAGQIDRPPAWWQRFAAGQASEPTLRTFVHDGADGPDGVLAWRPEGHFDFDTTMATVHVVEFAAATAGAYRDLWAYLSRLDVTAAIRLTKRPVDEPARWLLADGRVLRETYAGDFLWLRLLDPCAALAARTYATADRLVLDLLEHGVVELDGGPDGATCTPTTRSPDLRMSARVLASSYLGGYGLGPRALTGDVEEVTSGAVPRLDAMLATPLAPWCQTGF